MKKRIFTLVFLCMAFAIISNAQTTYDVGLTDTLNVFVANNSDPAGSIYVLPRGSYYVMWSGINVTYDITFKAADGEGSKPLIVNSYEGGWEMMTLGGNVTFENIHLNFSTYDGGRGGWHQGGIGFSGDNTTLSVDNCILDFCDGWGFHTDQAANPTLIFTNNQFRKNGIITSGRFHSQLINVKNADVEMVYLENNTFFEGVAPIFIFQFGNLRDVWINHNTFVSHAQFPFLMDYAHEDIIMNNLFVDAQFTGERAVDSRGQDVDGLPYGIINFADYEAGDTLKPEGFPDADERILGIGYNANHVTPETRFFWDNYVTYPGLSEEDTFQVAEFLNSRTESMFNDDLTYPYLAWDDTLSVVSDEAPGFTNYTIDTQYQVLYARSVNGDTTALKDVPDAGVWSQWPITDDPFLPHSGADLPADYYNFSYTNDNLKEKVAYLGYPVGDLNWWPAKKAIWEADPERETFENRKQAILDGTFFSYSPTGFDDPAALNQIRIYPNPASGSVMIDVDGPVNLTLFNIMGQSVYQCRTNNGVVDISGLESGFYLMQIDHLGKTYVQKLVVR
ncbi:MAG: T9SS type A sorting domain-containing protein [Bacteroidales bacterium]|nr:T9SS type A sorting domain-containing protein [Bacteroidales bacterium]